MNRNPYVPPEQRAEYLRSSMGEGTCTAQTCHVHEHETPKPGGEAGTQAATGGAGEPEPKQAQENAATARKTAPARKRAAKKAAPRRKRAAK